MITLRKPLLAKLRTLDPAVAENAIVPAYTHVCFTGEHLMTTNERIAMSVPHTSDFIGLIPAKILPDLLAMSAAPAVEIRPDSEGMARVTLGDMSVKLPMQPLENWPFEMPPIVPQQPLSRQRFCTQWSTACSRYPATPPCPTSWG